MSAARAVLYAEIVYVEAHLAKSRSGRCAGEAGTDNDDVEVALVGRVYEVLMSFVVGPFLSDRTFGDFRVNRVLRHVAAFDVGVFVHDRC